MKFDYVATTPLVNETLGSDFVGIKVRVQSSYQCLKRRKARGYRKNKKIPITRCRSDLAFSDLESPNLQIAAVGFSSDGESLDLQPRSLNVDDILIEARREDGRTMLFCLWVDFDPVDASWVSSADISAGLRDWWSVEREICYALFNDEEIVSYENCLRYLQANMQNDVGSFVGL